jgi:uncharacterized protein
MKYLCGRRHSAKTPLSGFVQREKEIFMTEKKTATRGFGSMDPQRQREIASQGGKKAHELGKAHQFNSETGRAAAKRSKAGSAVTAAAAR